MRTIAFAVFLLLFLPLSACQKHRQPQPTPVTSPPITETPVVADDEEQTQVVEAPAETDDTLVAEEPADGEQDTEEIEADLEDAATEAPLEQVVITTRVGAVIAGGVLSRDQHQVTLQHGTSTLAVAWHDMRLESFQSIHPELYEQLKQQAMERRRQEVEAKQAAGLVQINGVWMTKERAQHALLKTVRLGVLTSVRKTGTTTPTETTVQSGFSSAARRYSSSRITSVTQRGVCTIVIDELRPQHLYQLRAEVVHYLRDRDSGDIKEEALSHSASISNTLNKTIEIESSEFSLETLVQRSRRRGIDRETHGAESYGWAVRIWLNDVKVYEQARASAPIYHIVGRK